MESVECKPVSRRFKWTIKIVMFLGGVEFACCMHIMGILAKKALQAGIDWDDE